MKLVTAAQAYGLLTCFTPVSSVSILAHTREPIWMVHAQAIVETRHAGTVVDIYKLTMYTLSLSK